MQGTPSPSSYVSTKLERIAMLAKIEPKQVLTTLAHHIDVGFLREAFRLTRKDGAVGVDAETAADYAANLESNLESLLDRLKSGGYRAPPVRRVHIPKGDGSRTRPIGIPTFEDKLLQRSVSMILDAVYEQDFFDGSYGFRRGRSQHQALQALWRGLTEMGGGVLLEADIESFFDAIDHGHLRSFLDHRVRDGVLRRAIDKWLKAGVLEDGALSYPESGTPQGGVISPLLANIYLHEVLDAWFEQEVKPRLTGRAFLIRFADDFVIAFANEADAHRVFAVLPKRFERYGLTLHPTKTRLVQFRRPRRDGDDPGSFDFLGFTHHWGRSFRGNWVVRRRTSRKRFARAVRAIDDWCRTNRHLPLAEQRRQLRSKLQGHYNYYGITGNFAGLHRFFRIVERCWQRWLGRRSNRGYMDWERFRRLKEFYALPRPRIVHRYGTNSAN